MKKLLLVAVALLLLPLFASAQDAENLLVPDGTLYMIRQSDQPLAGVKNDSAAYLVLTTRRGDDITSEPVPATLTSGVHSNAAMAYDAEAGMLYIFWLRHTGLLESELLFTSIDSKGVWSQATAFGQPFDYREHLRIAVTRKVVSEGDRLQPGITVHVTWWETDTHTGTESAKYAVLGIENGNVEVSFLDLSQFVTPLNGEAPADLTKDELAVLRYPVLQASQKQESVLVTFGDMDTRKLHRVRVYPVRGPVANGRLRVPVGRADGDVGAPRFDKAANSTMNAVSGIDTDRLALYVREGSKLHYVLLRDGKWSTARSIALDDQINALTAVDAIRRLVNEH